MARIIIAVGEIYRVIIKLSHESGKIESILTWFLLWLKVISFTCAKISHFPYNIDMLICFHFPLYKSSSLIHFFFICLLFCHPDIKQYSLPKFSNSSCSKGQFVFLAHQSFLLFVNYSWNVSFLPSLWYKQGRIQDFHWGGGGATYYVRARTLRAGSSRGFWMLSRALLFETFLSIFFKGGGQKIMCTHRISRAQSANSLVQDPLKGPGPYTA